MRRIYRVSSLALTAENDGNEIIVTSDGTSDGTQIRDVQKDAIVGLALQLIVRIDKDEHLVQLELIQED